MYFVIKVYLFMVMKRDSRLTSKFLFRIQKWNESEMGRCGV